MFAKSDKESKDEGDISPFQSLMTALAATIGTGNIVGAADGHGIWSARSNCLMWISALFDSQQSMRRVFLCEMSEKNDRGEMAGGPMYAMKNDLNKETWTGFLAFLFALFLLFLHLWNWETDTGKFNRQCSTEYISY